MRGNWEILATASRGANLALWKQGRREKGTIQGRRCVVWREMPKAKNSRLDQFPTVEKTSFTSQTRAAAGK